MDKITVIVADDHPIFRLGLENVVKQSNLVNLVGLAENGTDALKMIQELTPKVAVLDIQMPGLNGLKVCEQVIAQKLPTQLILLTLYKEKELYNRARQMGIGGYLLKETAPSELIKCIASVASGNKYVSSTIDELLNDSRHSLPENLREAMDKLSNTEIKILLLISQHCSSKEIADRLFISEKTVENHRYNIGKKLGLSGTHNGLLKFAIEHSTELSTL